MESGSVFNNRPNLYCRKCSKQLPKTAVNKLDTSDYNRFSEDFHCPRCKTDIHPEDSFFDFLKRVPDGQYPGWPVELGGFATIGSQEVPVGKTEEVPLIGSDGLDILLTLLADTDLPGGAQIDDFPSDMEWFPGPRLIDDSVVVDVTGTKNGKIGFITSERSDYGETVTFAYHLHVRPEGIPQPPWISLLNEAVQSYHRGNGLATISLLFAAFENVLCRELMRTLLAIGYLQYPAQKILDEHYRWTERCKGAMEKATRTRFPAEYPDLWEDLLEFRDVRNDQIIHVDPDDNVADLTIPELKEGFNTLVNAMIAVHSICDKKRREMAELRKQFS